MTLYQIDSLVKPWQAVLRRNMKKLHEGSADLMWAQELLTVNNSHLTANRHSAPIHDRQRGCNILTRSLILRLDAVTANVFHLV